MRKRLFGWGWLAAALCAALAGCSKSGQDTPRSLLPPTPAASDTIAHIHWLGMDRVAADTNAAYFMTLWRMPEAQKLQAQTLDKLALAPWRLSGTRMDDGGQKMETGGPASTNSGLSTINSPLSTTPLRPLLDDVLAKESYLELRQPDTNAPVELAFAIRLTPDRAALWQTNLATALASLTGTRPTPTPSGWTLAFSLQPLAFSSSRLQPSAFSLSHTGDWTVVALTATNHPAFQLSGLSTINSPLSTNWLEADVDLSRLPSPLSVLMSSNLTTLHAPRATDVPRVSLRIFGDRRNVATEAQLDFPQPLGLQLEPWNVPTNLVCDPLIGFMAMRGIRPWLASLPLWSDLGLGTPPNQAYFWAQRGLQRFHYMAMPSANASNQVVKLSEVVLDKINPIFANAALKLGLFHSRSNAPGLVWRGFPLLSPNLGYTNWGDNAFILAGFSPTSLTNRPAPDALFQQLYAASNLVFYDWEITGECADGLGQLSQMLRYLLNRARLTGTAGLDWLIATHPKLGPAVTGVTLTAPNQLTFHRRSTIGLTGIEIQLWLDWLESPAFPVGLHSLLVHPQPIKVLSSAPAGTDGAGNPDPNPANAR